MIDWCTCYSEGQGGITWEGYHIQDENTFKCYLQGTVCERLYDKRYVEEYLEDVTMIMSETDDLDMDFSSIKKVLCFDDENENMRKAWEIGEALAECILEKKSGAIFPWNKDRDKRIDSASLPGADLVGLKKERDTYIILFGEVKTSNDAKCPPNVLYGRNGMQNQLKSIYIERSLRKRLLYYLYCHCKNTPMYEFYEQAIKEYVASEGKLYVLIGFLIRDTKPNKKDLESRGLVFSRDISLPTIVELHAWYVPIKFENWPLLIRGS